jgi:hypothetical protein
MSISRIHRFAASAHIPHTVPILRATRVLSSSRRGSSWPIEVETEAGPYFVKLAGSGHGRSAMIAEVIVGELAETIGLRVPGRALLQIDAELESENRDPELLELLQASHGLNLGMAALHGARNFAPEDIAWVSADEASRIVWLDWLVMNPDRTAANPNLMVRRGTLWLIDHGSALVFHHDWPSVTEASPHRPWDMESHVLRARATKLRELDALLSGSLTREQITGAVSAVPDEFLRPLVLSGAPDACDRRRAAYAAFLWKRLTSPVRVSVA